MTEEVNSETLRQTERRDWYSEGMSEETKTVKKLYAKILRPEMMIDEKERLRLVFDLRYEDGPTCKNVTLKPKDARELLVRTKSKSLRKLEGKIVEAYVDTTPRGDLKGISINPYLA